MKELQEALEQLQEEDRVRVANAIKTNLFWLLGTKDKKKTALNLMGYHTASEKARQIGADKSTICRAKNKIKDKIFVFGKFYYGQVTSVNPRRKDG